jgi:hypothetical protein
MIYLEAFMVSAGFKVSELALFTPRRRRIGSLHSGGAARSQAARSRRCQILDSTFIYAALEMIIRPLTTAGS